MASWARRSGPTAPIGLDLMRVQFPMANRNAIGSKPGFESLSMLVGGALHPAAKRIARLILCFSEQTLIVLHGFIKKTEAPRISPSRSRERRVTNETQQACWLRALDDFLKGEGVLEETRAIAGSGRLGQSSRAMRRTTSASRDGAAHENEAGPRSTDCLAPGDSSGDIANASGAARAMGGILASSQCKADLRVGRDCSM